MTLAVENSVSDNSTWAVVMVFKSFALKFWFVWCSGSVKVVMLVAVRMLLWRLPPLLGGSGGVPTVANVNGTGTPTVP